jgi:HK97 family phage prohead protease
MAVKHLNFNFEIKKSTKDGIIIEGLANAATVDRMNEIIDPSGWMIENYMKNPVVLFDHGHDPVFGHMPVGRALAVEPRQEGLWTKIQLSSSKTEKISAIRDLVEEGILKTFSVGFDPKEMDKSAENPDVVIIRKAELIENSIVPIPMNQDSTFSLLRKRKAYWRSPIARKWYDCFLDRVKLVKKGAWVAAALHQRFYDLMETGEIRNRDAALRYIADEANVNVSDVKAVLSGETTPVGLKLLKAFSNILRIDGELLTNLNNGDVALLDRMMAREELEASKVEQRGGEPVKKKNSQELESKPNEEQPKEEPAAEAPKEEPKEVAKALSDSAMVVHQVLVDKQAAESMEAAAQAIGNAGYAVADASETDEAYVFVQIPADQVKPDEGVLVDLGSGVYVMVAPKVGAGEQEAPETAEEETEAEVVEESATEEEKIEEEKSLEHPATKGVDAGPTDDNPYLELSRQTNVLLGTLINAVQTMSSKLDGITDITLEVAKDQGEESVEEPKEGEDKEEGKDDEEVSKSLDLIRDYHSRLDANLKRLDA